jgi:hypothetical protein
MNAFVKAVEGGFEQGVLGKFRVGFEEFGSVFLGNGYELKIRHVFHGDVRDARLTRPQKASGSTLGEVDLGKLETAVGFGQSLEAFRRVFKFSWE